MLKSIQRHAHGSSMICKSYLHLEIHINQEIKINTFAKVIYIYFEKKNQCIENYSCLDRMYEILMQNICIYINA